jgi:hypothetical protein
VRRIVLVVGLLVALLVPASAQASSLVFNREDGNVWIANPDGSGLYQVTLDGDEADPYGPPSQADDGTIVTTAGDAPNEEIIRLKQNGEVLSAFKPAIEFSLGISNSDVSPDGSRVAYTTGFLGNSTCSTEVSVGTPGSRFCYSTFVTAASSPTNQGANLASQDRPSWMSATRLLTGDGSNLHTWDVGGTDVQWFGGGPAGDPTSFPEDGEWNGVANRLAATTGVGPQHITMYSTAANLGSGAHPTVAPTAACRLDGPTGGQFNDPTWSPDGNSIAWEETDGNPNVDVSGEGIWIWPLGAGSLASRCTSPPPVALPGSPAIPFASNPDFGPANVNPGPRPVPPSSGGTGGSTGSGSGGGTTSTTSTPTSPPPVCCAPPPPQPGTYTLTNATSNADGTVTIRFTAPGAGRLDALGKITSKGKGVAAARRKKPKTIIAVRAGVTVGQAGPVELKLTLTRKARAILKKKGRLTVPVKFTFTPRDGGSPTSVTQGITFTLKKLR